MTSYGFLFGNLPNLVGLGSLRYELHITCMTRAICISLNALYHGIQGKGVRKYNIASIVTQYGICFTACRF